MDPGVPPSNCSEKLHGKLRNRCSGAGDQMAALLKTGRPQVVRLLDPENDFTLSSLQRAAGGGGTACEG